MWHNVWSSQKGVAGWHSCQATEGRQSDCQRSDDATEQALRLATAFTLLISVFIIYNTFQITVGERRRKLGILRAIGATRWQVIRFLLAEAALLGILGTLAGAFLGTVGAYFLTKQPPTYCSRKCPILSCRFFPSSWQWFFGIGISLLGAILPARRAGRLARPKPCEPSLQAKLNH